MTNARPVPVPARTIHTAPPVTMFTAPNAGPKTLDGTHSFLVGRLQAYLIDPGPELDQYGEALIGWLTSHAVALQGILLTHSHPDHAPGAALLSRRLQAPVWASELAGPGPWAVHVDHRYTAGESFPVDGDRLSVLPTPGHAQDHVAFWLSGARILFSGDTILGAGTTLVAPPEGNMQQYMQTLYALRDLDARLIAPGHGPLIDDPRSKIDEYIAHRSRREEEILAVLRAGPAGIEELLKLVYAGIDPRLHDFARGSIRGQLEKLQAEGKVTARDGRYVVAAPASAD